MSLEKIGALISGGIAVYSLYAGMLGVTIAAVIVVAVLLAGHNKFN
jgi:hypothetical protein